MGALGTQRTTPALSGILDLVFDELILFLEIVVVQVMARRTAIPIFFWFGDKSAHRKNSLGISLGLSQVGSDVVLLAVAIILGAPIMLVANGRGHLGPRIVFVLAD